MAGLRGVYWPPAPSLGHSETYLNLRQPSFNLIGSQLLYKFKTNLPQFPFHPTRQLGGGPV